MIGKFGQIQLFRSRLAILGQAPSTPLTIESVAAEVKRNEGAANEIARTAGSVTGKAAELREATGIFKL